MLDFGDHETIFDFITRNGTFSYNGMTDGFKGKFQIR